MTGKGLHEFVAEYGKAYVCEDARIPQIPEVFFCPSMFLRRDTVVRLDAPAKIHDFLQTSVRAFRDDGSMNSGGRLVEGRRVGPRFALVEVAWAVTSAECATVMQVTTTYNRTSW